jgi:hypothetical protein
LRKSLGNVHRDWFATACWHISASNSKVYTVYGL